MQIYFLPEKWGCPTWSNSQKLISSLQSGNENHSHTSVEAKSSPSNHRKSIKVDHHRMDRWTFLTIGPPSSRANGCIFDKGPGLYKTWEQKLQNNIPEKLIVGRLPSFWGQFRPIFRGYEGNNNMNYIQPSDFFHQFTTTISRWKGKLWETYLTGYVFTDIFLAR